MPTLVHRIREHAQAAPGEPALYGPVRDDWRQLSRGSWWSSVRQAAGGLVGLGVVPDEPVILWAPARPEWAVAWLALCAVGARPILVAPDADDTELVASVSDPEVHRVVTSGRERLERLLLLREHRSLALERVITLDRPELAAPRLTDLETLIERGSARSDHVEQRMRALSSDSVAAVLPSGAMLSHGEIEELAPDVDGAVLLVASPASRAAQLAIAAALTSGVELWMGGLVADPLAALLSARPAAALLEPEAWRLVHQRVEERIDAAGALRSGVLRAARLRSFALVRALAGPILEELGVERCRVWCDSPLESAVADGLRAMGLEVGSPGLEPRRRGSGRRG